MARDMCLNLSSPESLLHFCVYTNMNTVHHMRLHLSGKYERKLCLLQGHCQFDLREKEKETTMEGNVRKQEAFEDSTTAALQ